MVRTLLSSIAGLLLVGCAFGSSVAQEPTPLPTAQVAATVPTPLPTAQVAATVPTPLPTAQVAATVPTPLPTAQAKATEEVVEFVKGSFPIYFGRPSIGENIAGSSVIIRGTFDSVRAVGVRHENLAPGRYVGGLEFTFTALEYLKGSGDAQLRVVATVWYDSKADTADAAADLARPHIDLRDTRWDGRQAIVFMRESEDGYLWMGAVDAIMLGGEYPVWLPDASATSTSTRRSATTSEQYFLLDEPDPVRASRSSPAVRLSTDPSSPSTISLSDIKSRVNAMEARIAAGGSSEAYRECVYMTHYFNRLVNFATTYSRTDGAIQSGLPAGTRMVEYIDTIWINIREYGTPPPAWVEDNVWYEGRDASLIDYEYPGYAISRRPLPFGEYRAFLMWRTEAMLPCEGDPEALKGLYENVVTVSAPAGTLHEAFFDPVADTSTSAVGAVGSIGVLEPASFTLEGAGSTTIERIEWKSGSVLMELAPHSPLTDHHMDFIEIDGSVGLSLDFDDAVATTTDDGSNALSWTVADSPWADGDLLMLRIYRIPPPEFANAPYAFSLSEDVGLGHAVGSVSAVSPSGASVTYSIARGNTESSFSIDPQTGAITTTEFLDYETLSSYRLVMSAEDPDGVVATLRRRLRLRTWGPRGHRPRRTSPSGRCPVGLTCRGGRCPERRSTRCSGRPRRSRTGSYPSSRLRPAWNCGRGTACSATQGTSSVCIPTASRTRRTSATGWTCTSRPVRASVKRTGRMKQVYSRATDTSNTRRSHRMWTSPTGQASLDLTIKRLLQEVMATH